MTTENGEGGHPARYDAVRNHVTHSRQYLDNAHIALQDGEAGKAGELLWGSMAQAFHALAAWRNRNLATHRDFKNFAFYIGSSTGNQLLRGDFENAEKLHDNFYDVILTIADVEKIIPAVNRLVGLAFGLLPRDFLEDSTSQG